LIIDIPFEKAASEFSLRLPAKNESGVQFIIPMMRGMWKSLISEQHNISILPSKYTLQDSSECYHKEVIGNIILSLLD